MSTLLIMLLAAATLVAGQSVGSAVPPPPPNPSDEDIQSGRDGVDATAGQVGALANRVAEADAQLLEMQSEVALAREETNRALLELQIAQDAAAAALAVAAAARVDADNARVTIRAVQEQLDEFAAGSYRQGSTIGSITAFLGSDSPEDLLVRAELLDSVSGSQLDALENMQRARAVKANKDSAARAALQEAQAKEQLATEARAAADAAYDAAIAAEQAQAARTAELETVKGDLERQLFDAQQAVAGLEGQRRRYEDWQAQRAAAEAAAAEAAAATLDDDGGAPDVAPPSSGDAVRDVINRATAQLDVRYSWGGGNAKGATKGIRDGGVADSFGDYRKVGFDCSGLMIYAFAPSIGRSLPHYSGSQYNSGRKVPLARKRPGDMLFWATRGRIHHVALYIGDGKMIEAPQSGSAVRISSVRTSGIMPHAVRLL
ncbi:MAG: NlpC/P60 family protein [Actinomycetota bacterium]|nr:NlpC/P60 family protein [Actinomycetota bacterium]